MHTTIVTAPIFTGYAKSVKMKEVVQDENTIYTTLTPRTDEPYDFFGEAQENVDRRTQLRGTSHNGLFARRALGLIAAPFGFAADNKSVHPFKLSSGCWDRRNPALGSKMASGVYSLTFSRTASSDASNSPRLSRRSRAKSCISWQIRFHSLLMRETALAERVLRLFSSHPDSGILAKRRDFSGYRFLLFLPSFPISLDLCSASRTVAGGNFLDALERSVHQRKHGIQIVKRLKRRIKAGSVLHKLRCHEQSRNH